MTPSIIAAHEEREARKRANNQPLFEKRRDAFQRWPGPRVGDFIRLPALHPKLGQWTRFTHNLQFSIFNFQCQT